MSSVPQLNLTLLQQLSVFTAGLKSGLSADYLLQELKERSANLPDREAALLRQMGEDLQSLQEGKRAGSSDVPSLLRELTHAVDHQMRNAHNVAAASLQTGEMDLDGLVAVLSARGDTQGLLALEQARAHLRTAREGLLRATAFLGVLGNLHATPGTGEEFERSVRLKIAELMNWKPEVLSEPQPAPHSSSSVPGLSVLYVEDDPDAGDLVDLFMQRLDFVGRVHRSASYAGALQVFSRHPSISILVTDYHLEEQETGLDLAREIQRRRPGLRTLFTTGSVNELKDLLTEKEKNDFVLISKPFDLVDLETQLRETVRTDRLQ